MRVVYNNTFKEFEKLIATLNPKDVQRIAVTRTEFQEILGHPSASNYFPVHCNKLAGKINLTRRELKRINDILAKSKNLSEVDKNELFDRQLSLEKEEFRLRQEVPNELTTSGGITISVSNLSA